MISDKCEEELVQIGDVTIPFWTYGKKSNPVIIYLHGMARSFSDNDGDLPVRYLMENYCVVAFDLPGWGVNKKVTISANQIINEISKNINAKKFFIFGTSYGGIVALSFASKNSEKLKGIILAGVPRFGLKSIPSLLYFVKFFSPNTIHVAIDLISVSRTVSNINVPTLLLYSKNDSIATISQGSYLENKIRNSRLVTISDRTHGWLLHRILDNDFGKEIDTFLETYS